jgi:hypothetical protein
MRDDDVAYVRCLYGVVRREVTVQELLRMPDDGFRYELVRGELRQTAPGGTYTGA